MFFRSFCFYWLVNVGVELWLTHRSSDDKGTVFIITIVANETLSFNDECVNHKAAFGHDLITICIIWDCKLYKASSYVINWYPEDIEITIQAKGTGHIWQLQKSILYSHSVYTNKCIKYKSLWQFGLNCSLKLQENNERKKKHFLAWISVPPDAYKRL